MSIEAVYNGKWRLALAALIGIAFSGGLLVFALMLGYANPPHEQHAILELSQPPIPTFAANNLNFAPVDTLPEPPFTIDVSATFMGFAEWGIWLGKLELGTSPQWFFLIDGDGYVMAGSQTILEWQPFIHARSDTNDLYLHIDSSYQAIFRVNDEIAWEGQLTSQGLEWGIVSSNSSSVQWNMIRLYAD